MNGRVTVAWLVDPLAVIVALPAIASAGTTTVAFALPVDDAAKIPSDWVVLPCCNVNSTDSDLP